VPGSVLRVSDRLAQKAVPIESSRVIASLARLAAHLWNQRTKKTLELIALFARLATLTP
jgi:hypothetical protein